MSWLHNLYETFERCHGSPEFHGEEAVLVPVSHTIQQAHIEIVIDDKGYLLRAAVVGKEETVIPATEGSAGRTSGAAPHPLADKLQYCAADYPSFGGKKTSYFELYREQLQSWCCSPYSHPNVEAVFLYIDRRVLVSDLCDRGILHLDANGELLTSWEGEEQKPEIFKVLAKQQGKQDQGDALVRWIVESPGVAETKTWRDSSVIDRWARYDASINSRKGFCMVLGTEAPLAEQHPAKIRDSGDKAKLISSNDSNGFTFRGRFNDGAGRQACEVGYEVTQKAHSALRWLIKRQGIRLGDQAFVAWASAGVFKPPLISSTIELFELESLDVPQVDRSNKTSGEVGDVGQFFSLQLTKLISGYARQLGSAEHVAVMGLDSATPGRMAITYYREFSSSEFLDRVKHWHAEFSWFQRYSQEHPFKPKKRQVVLKIAAPSPSKIIEVAYGRRSDDKLRKKGIERLLPCIVDAQAFPSDLLRSCIRRVSNKYGFSANWEWEEALGVACAVYRGSRARAGNGKQGINYLMTLEQTRRSRDYLYGRLLAFADHIESRALYISGEKDRDTHANKLMMRFADRPFSTWKTIHNSLAPYLSRLRSRRPGYLYNLEKQLGDVHDLFDVDDFADDTPLDGEFLLGFYCQRQALRHGNQADSSEDLENENLSV